MYKTISNSNKSHAIRAISVCSYRATKVRHQLKCSISMRSPMAWIWPVPRPSPSCPYRHWTTYRTQSTTSTTCGSGPCRSCHIATRVQPVLSVIWPGRTCCPTSTITNTRTCFQSRPTRSLISSTGSTRIPSRTSSLSTHAIRTNTMAVIYATPKIFTPKRNFSTSCFKWTCSITCRLCTSPLIRTNEPLLFSTVSFRLNVVHLCELHFFDRKIYGFVFQNFEIFISSFLLCFVVAFVFYAIMIVHWMKIFIQNYIIQNYTY